jgi:hypothetical protein
MIMIMIRNTRAQDKFLSYNAHATSSPLLLVVFVKRIPGRYLRTGPVLKRQSYQHNSTYPYIIYYKIIMFWRKLWYRVRKCLRTGCLENMRLNGYWSRPKLLREEHRILELIMEYSSLHNVYIGYAGNRCRKMETKYWGPRQLKRFMHNPWCGNAFVKN